MATSNSTPRVALYARVSTTDQSTDPQLLDLRRFTQERGWNVFKEYCDNGISGTQGSRPGLNELMNGARKRRFDVVLVWRFDRFARSTRHLINALEEFWKRLGVPHVCLDVVLGDTFAVVITETQVELGIGVSLIGR